MFRDGTFTLLCPEDEQVFAYTRDTEHGHLLVVCNFSGEEAAFAWPEAYCTAKTLIANYNDRAPVLRSYEAAMVYYED